MSCYIESFNNQNKPIVNINNSEVSLVYFNHLLLKKEETDHYCLEYYESIIVDKISRSLVQDFSFR